MSDHSLAKRLEALAAFAPIFDAQDFSFGEWHSSPGHFPWFELSSEANRFLFTASQFGWVVPGFDWPAWLKTDEARQLLDDPQAIAGATAKDLECRLTAHIRADRFNEGHFASAFETGHLTAIARRAAMLLHDIKGS